MTKTYEFAAILLLRTLSGRLADSTLMSLWSYLGAGEYALLEDTLFGCLAQEGVWLSGRELTLFREMLDDPEDARLAEITASDAEEPQPRYEFVGSVDNDGRETAMTDADTIVINKVSELPAARRVLRARRLPLDALAEPATWVYLVEVATGTYVPHVLPDIDSELLVQDAGCYPVEVFTENEQLPPYHTAALSVAHQIWPTLQ